jgi:biotin carboxyl carrier protein
MKLETTIRAWHDGLVADLHVAAGQSFDRDAILVTLVAEAA